MHFVRSYWAGMDGHQADGGTFIQNAEQFNLTLAIMAAFKACNPDFMKV